METSNFYEITVCHFALRPPVGHTSCIDLHNEFKSSARCYAKVKFNDGLVKIVPDITIVAPAGRHQESGPEVAFTFTSAELRNLTRKTNFLSTEVYASFRFDPVTGEPSPPDWILGRVTVPLDLSDFEDTPSLIEHGWREVFASRSGNIISQLHFSVYTAKQERFVIGFDNAPQKNPKVLNIRGSTRYPIPVFTCSFVQGFGQGRIGLQNPANGRGIKQWFKKTLNKGKEIARQGPHWSVVIYDQSVTMAASAVLVTPFLSTAQPGSWIISLRPKNKTEMVPWGNLNVWGKLPDGKIDYSFEFLTKKIRRISSFRSEISAKNGGTFLLDLHADANNGIAFIMSAIINREGNKYRSPHVEVAAKYIKDVEELAAYVALAAAVDLSVDASRCLRT